MHITVMSNRETCHHVPSLSRLRLRHQNTNVSRMQSRMRMHWIYVTGVGLKAYAPRIDFTRTR